ncbi:MAG: thioredoxin family protein, partial [Chloroflexi bacterium]|nr:thioredoxin family protein [Chloroflexota bacterium]
MPVLSQQDKQTLQKRFKKDLKRDITLTLVTVRSAGVLVIPGRECPTCPQTQELLQELVALSPKLHLRLYDFYTQAQEAQALGVERVPCILLSGDGEGGSNFKY